jgi:K+-transporting ATPase KdpF subunit
MDLIYLLGGIFAFVVFVYLLAALFFPERF